VSELPEGVRGRVELVVRRGDGGRFLFLVNRTEGTVSVPGVAGEVLLGSADGEGAVALGPRGVAVVRQAVV
jgi:beta-galactosidase